MDDFPRCCVMAAVPVDAVESRMFGPTYVELQEGHDVLVVAAPGIAVGTSEFDSGTRTLTIFLYSLADASDPQDEAVGMGHNLSFENARRIAASIVALCDEAEAASSTTPANATVQ